MLQTLLIASLLTSAGEPITDQDADTAAYVGERGGTSIYDFGDDLVEGELLTAEGANIHARPGVRFASLLDLRPHFIDRLIWMTYDAP